MTNSLTNCNYDIIYIEQVGALFAMEYKKRIRGSKGVKERIECGMRSAEFGIKVFCRFINKMKERSDTTIPHSEIHIPHFFHNEPIYKRIVEHLPLIGR